MKKILLAALLLLGLARGAQAGPYYSNTFDGSSTTLSMAGIFTIANPFNLAAGPALKIDGGTGIFSWAWGIKAATGSFTATGSTTYSVTTSSGINVAAGTVVAPSFVGAHAGDGSNLTGVGNAALAANSIDTTKLQAGAVTNAKLAANAVDTGKLAVTGVAAATYGSSGLIPVLAVTADGRITGGSSIAPVITNAMIAANAVDTSKLAVTGVAAGAYGSSTLVPTITVTADGRVTAVSVTSIGAGTVNASTFTINAIPPFATSNTVWTIVPGSTLTYTTNGTSPIRITVTSSFLQGSTGNLCSAAVFIDGAYLPGESASTGYGPQLIGSASAAQVYTFAHTVVAQSARSHTWTLGIKASGNTCTFGNASDVSQFVVEDK
jgi:hypothetical protein